VITVMMQFLPAGMHVDITLIVADDAAFVEVTEGYNTSPMSW
jgi:hypothetical protein